MNVPPSRAVNYLDLLTVTSVSCKHRVRNRVRRSWTSPEGYQLVFRYVADSSGFRVMGDAVPVDSEGVAANGEQVNPVTPNDGFVLSWRRCRKVWFGRCFCPNRRHLSMLVPLVFSISKLQVCYICDMWCCQLLINLLYCRAVTSDFVDSERVNNIMYGVCHFPIIVVTEKSDR